MITINLICVGNLKEKFLTMGYEEYKKRLGTFCNFNLIELKEVNYSNPTSGEIEKIKIEEGKKILENLKKFNILLDVGAKEFSSTEFAESLIKKQNSGISEITFIIGGSYGVSEAVKQKVNEKISFSKMTFPHGLMRVIFVEQLYRAFTIITNKGYHK